MVNSGFLHPGRTWLKNNNCQMTSKSVSHCPKLNNAPIIISIDEKDLNDKNMQRAIYIRCIRLTRWRFNQWITSSHGRDRRLGRRSKWTKRRPSYPSRTRPFHSSSKSKSIHFVRKPRWKRQGQRLDLAGRRRESSTESRETTEWWPSVSISGYRVKLAD